MTDEELEPETILNAFGDGLSRQILVLASRESVSIDDLDEYLDASRPTIYRRTSELVESDLLAVSRRINRTGPDFREFETTVNELSVAIEDGGLTIDVSVRSEIAGRFRAFWQGLERSINPIRPELIQDDRDNANRTPSE